MNGSKRWRLHLSPPKNQVESRSYYCSTRRLTTRQALRSTAPAMLISGRNTYGLGKTTFQETFSRRTDDAKKAAKTVQIE